MLAAGMEVTLAIRLKNECVSMSCGGEQDMINEVKLAQKIVDMFFSGIEIAPPGDAAMWGAVHSLLHYCSVSTLASMIVADRDTNFYQGLHCITEADAAAINGALYQCAQLLPVPEPIKIAGWNIRRAEEPSVGDKGKAAKYDRDMRLKGLKTWAAWLSNPYDELHGLNTLPAERRGRKYTFATILSDEFIAPPLDQWPKWTRPELMAIRDSLAPSVLTWKLLSVASILTIWLPSRQSKSPKLSMHVGGRPRKAPTASKSTSSQMVEMSVRLLRHPPLTLSITLKTGLATIIWVSDLLWLAAGNTVLVCYLREFDM